jgi:hypothetical protein
MLLELNTSSINKRGSTPYDINTNTNYNRAAEKQAGDHSAYQILAQVLKDSLLLQKGGI